jgi:hypothetical protein
MFMHLGKHHSDSQIWGPALTELDYLREPYYTNEPFDFGQCRRQLSIPASTEEHFSEVLSYCLDDQMKERFHATGKVLASSLLRHTIQEEKKGEL